MSYLDKIKQSTSEQGVDVSSFIEKMQEKIVEKKRKGILTEDSPIYSYKYEKVEHTDFYFVFEGRTFNFLGVRPSHDRVEIQVAGREVLLIYTEEPESLTRVIGAILVTHPEEEDFVDLNTELGIRGYCYDKYELVKGQLPVEELSLPSSEVLLEYEIRHNLISSRLGVTVGEKLVLIRIGAEQTILVVTSLGVLKLDVPVSDTLFDKIADMAETHRIKKELMRV